MTASAPYVRENGVSPVDLLGVVQYAHKTLGSSSAHLPLVLSNLFFNPFTIALLVASGLAVALQIYWGGIPILDSEITTELVKGFAIELQPVVRDQGLQHPKSGYYVLRGKF